MTGAAAGRVVFVTGTDTGVGKTWVACGLARALRSAGRSVAVRKPAETGCEPAPPGVAPTTNGAPGGPACLGSLFPADAAALRAAAGASEPLEAICGVRFAEALAPGVAAQRAGVEIDVPSLVGLYRARAREVDILIVEGAGGLLVPLHRRTSYAELAGHLGAGLVVVVGARLGAINHTLLTIEAARARGLRVHGLVVNHPTPHRDLAIDTLADTLGSLAEVPVLAEIPYDADPACLLPLAEFLD